MGKTLSPTLQTMSTDLISFCLLRGKEIVVIANLNEQNGMNYNHRP